MLLVFIDQSADYTRVENKMRCTACNVFLLRTENARNLLWGKPAVANVCVGASTSIWKENNGQFAQMNNGQKKTTKLIIAKNERVNLITINLH